MRLSDNKYEEIKKIIVEVIFDYGICSIPINVFSIAKKMKIKLIKYSEFPINEFDKVISCTNDGISWFSVSSNSYCIAYNDNMDENRIRFTIAHELGHIILGHKEYNIVFESEANFFARSLLIPLCFIIKFGLFNIEDIKKNFKVSTTVSKIAIKNAISRINAGYDKLEDYEIELLNMFKKDKS